MLPDLKHFDRLINEKGWIVFDSVVPTSLVDDMKSDLQDCYTKCRELQIKHNIAKDTPYTVHHLVGQAKSFLKYLELNPIDEYITHYFSGKYILNSFGGAINKANSSSYANKVHRDIRTFSGDNRLILNTLIMLDDFTEFNGATKLLSGSHNSAEKPSEEYFEKYSERALGRKGSILLFNSNVWHAGGNNVTNTSRSSVTPMYSKPFMKQQFDYSQAIGYENIENFDEPLKQVLGYYSRTPSTLEQWYQPPNKRMYRPDQG